MFSSVSFINHLSMGTIVNVGFKETLSELTGSIVAIEKKLYFVTDRTLLTECERGRVVYYCEPISYIENAQKYAQEVLLHQSLVVSSTKPSKWTNLIIMQNCIESMNAKVKVI